MAGGGTGRRDRHTACRRIINCSPFAEELATATVGAISATAAAAAATAAGSNATGAAWRSTRRSVPELPQLQSCLSSARPRRVYSTGSTTQRSLARHSSRLHAVNHSHTVLDDSVLQERESSAERIRIAGANLCVTAVLCNAPLKGMRLCHVYGPCVCVWEQHNEKNNNLVRR